MPRGEPRTGTNQARSPCSITTHTQPTQRCSTGAEALGHTQLRPPHTQGYQLTAAFVHASQEHVIQLALVAIEQRHTYVSTHLAMVKR